MAKTKQLSFDDVGIIKRKVFTHHALAKAKITYLEERIEDLTFSEVTWLSRIEEFFSQKSYITEKQIEVLHALVVTVKSRGAKAS